MLNIQTFIVGQLQTNCYLVSDSASHEALIIDPGDEGSYIAEKITSGGYKPIAILATHGHFDHALAGFELQHLFNIPCYIHPSDEFLLSQMRESASYYTNITVVDPPFTPSKSLRKCVFFTLGSYQFDVMDTPGHTPGGVCFVCKKEHVAFTGDTVFQGGAVGNWYHTYSDKQSLDTSIRKILSLPKSTVLYPGHGRLTTVEQELVSQKMKI